MAEVLYHQGDHFEEVARESYLIMRDITGADLAFDVSREHKEMEEGG